MSKIVEKQVREIFEQLQEEGQPISLIDCSAEDDGDVWVAYALHQNPEEVAKLKKFLSETGNLLEPTEDLIEPIDEIYSTLKGICERATA